MFGKALKGTLGVGVGCVVLVLALVAISAFIGGFSRSSSSAPTTPPLSGAKGTAVPSVPAAKQWVAIKAWEGSGIKDTESFTVGAEWRIDWDFKLDGAAGTGIIQIYIHDAATQRMVDITANTSREGADSSFRRGAGTYYLKISSANGAWKVAVQDLR